MRWRELDLVAKVWTLPSERSKNRLPNMLPLSPRAWAIIEAQPRITGSDYVFGRARRGFSHMKRKLDAAMQINGPAWVTHDLRRTSRSLLSRAHRCGHCRTDARPSAFWDAQGLRQAQVPRREAGWLRGARARDRSDSQSASGDVLQFRR